MLDLTADFTDLLLLTEEPELDIEIDDCDIFAPCPILEAAQASVAAGEGFGNRAYISDVARRLGASVASLRAELIAANQAGSLLLCRADTVAAMDAVKVEASHIMNLDCDFHFIDLN